MPISSLQPKTASNKFWRIFSGFGRRSGSKFSQLFHTSHLKCGYSADPTFIVRT